MPVVLEPGEGPAGEQSPADAFLMDIAVVEWSARASDRWISRVDLEPEQATVHVSNDGMGRKFGPFAYGTREDLVRDLVLPAGLPVPDAWQEIPRVPSSLDATRDDREEWAYLLVDFAQYAWAFREEGLELRRLERTPGGAVAVVGDDGRRWVSFVPLPASGEHVGVAFEIVEWIADGSGLQVGDRRWARHVDKYQPGTGSLEAWETAWLRDQALLE